MKGTVTLLSATLISIFSQLASGFAITEITRQGPAPPLRNTSAGCPSGHRTIKVERGHSSPKTSEL